ncbi:4173_t:CDS:2 [Entrophospora sp. SA101]|nr:4173_t:CDS:2 [Entrophospora sp. SA101]CAJ0867669.1 4647_t:CDS:2 [Entrophospora sp. SA101]
MQQDNEREENKENKEEMQVLPSGHEPTTTLYIKNFVRPLTLAKVRELLEQYGQIEFFWMDKIKSHSKLAHQSLWDVVFPPETGRKLELEFIDFDKAEESERKKSNGNNETAPNVKIVSLDSLFSKTKTTPHLYYKPVSSEDAQSRLKVMERRRNRGHS